jgi:DNA-binding IscR family transcriptional regulator
MRRDSRLSVALHVLLHLRDLGSATSETLGPMMSINPVVLRRTFAGLRRKGILRAQKGHGGGWSLARPLEQVTLGDVHDALGAPAPFNIAQRDPRPRCPLEKRVVAALDAALADAEALLRARLADITVADLGRDLHPPRKGTHLHA